MSDRSRSRSPAKDGEASGGEEVNLYVGNLDYQTTEDDLRNAFSSFGTITKLSLPLDRESGRPRGFGFIGFDSRSAAEAAIAKMDQAELGSRNIRVNESRPRSERSQNSAPSGGNGGGGGFNASGAAEVKLYVGNLSYDTTEESLRDMFASCGVVSDAMLPVDRETGRIRGFAFVTMPAADAEKAIAMDGQEVNGRTLRINEAQPRESRGGGGRNRGRGGYGRGGY